MRESKDRVGQAKRRLAMGAVGVLGVAMVAAAGLLALEATSDTASTPSTTAAGSGGAGWGSSVLAKIHHGVIDQAPIRVANACGLGATSCFKCHNKSNRGPKPGQDKTSSPWHPQHSEVNYSCDGCHQGNPRLMVKNIAHQNLVADPRTAPQKTCGGCHKKNEISGLLSQYQGVGE
ncbi:MAG TPA: hypothetical protein VKA14_07085 [Gammaproteobacteria bacterium]|nr:hypothetical protein [Gammaproteobacteria bacterium]